MKKNAIEKLDGFFEGGYPLRRRFGKILVIEPGEVYLLLDLYNTSPSVRRKIFLKLSVWDLRRSLMDVAPWWALDENMKAPYNTPVSYIPHGGVLQLHESLRAWFVYMVQHQGLKKGRVFHSWGFFEFEYEIFDLTN